MKIVLVIPAIAIVVLGTCLDLQATRPPQTAASNPGSARLVITQTMPELDGKKLVATIVEVSYPPGGASQAHSHPCAVIAYVAEGSIESQVQGQPPQTYTAGQTFYEPPNGVHAISRNASDSKPARLLAYFLCDHPGPLTVPPVAQGGDKRQR
jgi:quercetin dioxygenase-like cupin family protein